MSFIEWIRWNLRGRPRWTQAEIDAAKVRVAELAERFRRVTDG